MNRNSFSSPFTIEKTFFSFSCLTSLARTSSSKLNKVKHKYQEQVFLYCF